MQRSVGRLALIRLVSDSFLSLDIISLSSLLRSVGITHSTMIVSELCHIIWVVSGLTPWIVSHLLLQNLDVTRYLLPGIRLLRSGRSPMALPVSTFEISSDDHVAAPSSLSLVDGLFYSSHSWHGKQRCSC